MSDPIDVLTDTIQAAHGARADLAKSRKQAQEALDALGAAGYQVLWVCPNCGGSGTDQTWHEGAPCAETHQCGYCMGDTARPAREYKP
jgi:DnaJ-class molecular chaperone